MEESVWMPKIPLHLDRLLFWCVIISLLLQYTQKDFSIYLHASTPPPSQKLSTRIFLE